MKIECLPSTTRKGEMVIFYEGEPWRTVHRSIFGYRPSLPRETTSLEELSQQFSLLEYRGAKHYLLKRLSAQSLPSASAAESLQRRMVSKETIERLLKELCGLGYLNDHEWTASYIRQQTARKIGPRKIACKLANKGISQETAKEALQLSSNEEQQRQLIAKLLETRYRSCDLTDFRAKQKVIASLVRRGFDLHVIISTLERELNNKSNCVSIIDR